MKCEREFEKIQLVTDYAKNVEPMKYVGLLMLGIFCCFLTLIFLVDAFTSIVKSKPDGMKGESDNKFEELQSNLIALLMKNEL